MLIVPNAPTRFVITMHVLPLREDGKESRLDFETGQTIMGISCGNGFYEFKIVDREGTTAAHYRLLGASPLV